MGCRAVWGWIPVASHQLPPPLPPLWRGLGQGALMHRVSWVANTLMITSCWMLSLQCESWIYDHSWETASSCDYCCINEGNMSTVSDWTCICLFCLQDDFEPPPSYRDHTRMVCHESFSEWGVVCWCRVDDNGDGAVFLDNRAMISWEWKWSISAVSYVLWGCLCATQQSKVGC